MKKCPFCAEDIQGEAVKCKHCGSWLDGRPEKPPEVPRVAGIDDQFDDHLRQLVKSGLKISAIKLVREQRGLDLAAAKTYVDRLAPAVSSDKKGGTRYAGIGCLTILALSILLSVIGHFSGSPSSSRPTTSPSTPSTSQEPERVLEVTEHHATVEGYASYVVGTVKNNTGKQYSYVQVEVNLYDKKGNQVGSTLANVNNLEPYGTWKFKALIHADRAAEYRIKAVHGW